MIRWDPTAISAAVRAGELTAVEVMTECLRRVEAENPDLGAFCAVDADQALRAAADVDAQIRAGEDPGVLAGVPLGVKDNEDAAGFSTTHGSRLYASAPRATGSSVVVSRLVHAGAVVVGKTNTSELAHKADTTNLLHAPTVNPLARSRSAGGSSGGSACAVASGMVPLATGSDGGGSLRIPGALCGLPAFKATPGWVPHGDTIPSWGELSIKGVLAPDVPSLRLAHGVITGHHPGDLRSLPAWAAPERSSAPVRRIAWSPTLGYAEVDGEVAARTEAAARAVADRLGATLEEVPSVFASDPLEPFLVLAMSRTQLAVDPDRHAELDPSLAFLLSLVVGLSTADVARADRRCFELLNEVNASVWDRGYDLLLTPTLAGQAGPVGGMGLVNGVEHPNWIAFTYPWNMCRHPAGSLPVGLTSEGTGIGLQLVGRMHDDLRVLDVMGAVAASLPS